ncbi:MAG: molybdopterin-guanine dinucleotide biosynthesis protein B [Candidatus Bathyarchaeum sp.]|nr:MAG: molybdopterin-guanine dinucleotide biosynthesis protein B [Candidatus Bathyarchaeum sp.]
MKKGECKGMFNKVIVAVVGSSNSGKTTAVEYIIKGLIEKGYSVASAKRIPEQEFTIDTEGKDTYKHAKAGSSTVLSVAPNELTVIKKVDTKKYSLQQLIAQIPDETDIIIVEGFKSLVGQDMTIPKIVAVKSQNEVSEALERYKNILAFITQSSDEGMEVIGKKVKFVNEPNELVELVYQKVAVLVERKRKREEKITIQVDEQMLPLGEFVQDIVRNSVLGMVSSLKGVKIKGEEKVSIVIKRLTRG